MSWGDDKRIASSGFGTSNLPQTGWGSQTADYENHTRNDEATGAVDSNNKITVAAGMSGRNRPTCVHPDTRR